jgi:non-ribosomal peptide synthetase component F
MHLSEIAAKQPDKPAVIMADGSRAVTFAELDKQSCQVSRLLAELGVGPGDHVAERDRSPEPAALRDRRRRPVGGPAAGRSRGHVLP